MSSRKHSNNTFSQKKVKEQNQPLKYCKVCHDAGKSEAEYRSHFVRASPEPGSKVVCPTLLSACCGYCGTTGHTPSYCRVLKTQKKQDQRSAAAAAAAPVVQEKKSTKKISNIFAAFDSDDEEDELPKKVQQQSSQSSPSMNNINFPALTTAASATAASATAASATAASAKPISVASKTPQCVAALQQLHPSLKVQAKRPEVDLPKAPFGKLVRKQAECAAAAIESEDEEMSQPSEIAVSAYYEKALSDYQQKEYVKASTLNWAAVDSDSDDEDW